MTLAEKLFGDEKCCVCFNMSEYDKESNYGEIERKIYQRLNEAVKSNPFSILLFEGIEKAHPKILDTIFKIFEEGITEDEKGDRVYFAETLVIFTGNLGTITKAQFGQGKPNITPDMEYPEVQQKVKQSIEQYFELELDKQEILNLIGENIIVFDFIRPDAASLILDAQIDKIKKILRIDNRINLKLADEARKTLLDESLKNLVKGGYGIERVVESLLITPLSSYLFNNSICENADIIIKTINADTGKMDIFFRKIN
jgi:ATP-dependent Clp protease ATP-binding subunit ClpA